MTHWKLTLAYDGTAFHGWQIQPGLPTIQGTLSSALHGITGERLLPQGAGRTDTGVHALGQVASFALQASVPAANLLRALNRILPAAIRVVAAEQVSPLFHARHSARGKCYEYRLFERRLRAEPGMPARERLCSPFLAPFVWDCRWPLQVHAMQEAAQALHGTRDFSAMAAGSAAAGDDTASRPNPVKTIHEAEWSRHGELLVFRVRGTGFLHHMVRNIVGTLVDIGRGSLAAADMARILASCDRSQAGPTAPARGLFLVEVLYPDDTSPSPATPDTPAEEVA